jgi:hypothetical protein
MTDSDTSIPDPADEPVIGVPRAGRILGGLGKSAAYDAARRGEIPTIRVGRRLLVPTARLRALLGLDADSAA